MLSLQNYKRYRDKKKPRRKTGAQQSKANAIKMF